VKAVLDSFLLVFASEMGDKTQLLALLLVARFRKPWIIMGGILAATLLNHGLASSIGGWLSHLVEPQALRWGLAGTFWVFGLWILLPDKEENLKEHESFGVFTTTAVSFFFAEMGDKTQLATVALGARFADPWLVTLGTTAGMLAADGLAVFFGERLTKRVPMAWIRALACLLFLAFGAVVAWGT
jgi:putative Ca2+/H+ antiporter (TMEM165/GDT1 family)